MVQNFYHLTDYAKSFSGFTPEMESLLQEIGPDIKPKLPEVTNEFYQTLSGISEAASYLEGRIEILKPTHLRWMESLFTGPYDQSYVQHMYQVGIVHVKVHLPVEFMAGSMTLINKGLSRLMVETYGHDQQKLTKVLEATGAITGLSLFVMQQSYQEASLAEELERFLQITGMSRVLFTNLASAYKPKPNTAG